MHWCFVINCEQSDWIIIFDLWLFTQKHCNFAKVGSKFFQILNRQSKNCQSNKNLSNVANFLLIWSHWRWIDNMIMPFISRHSIIGDAMGSVPIRSGKPLWRKWMRWFVYPNFNKNHVGGRSNQCDQIVRLSFNIWPFAMMKISPIMKQIRQSDSTFCQIRNKLSKNFKRHVKFCQIWSHWVQSKPPMACSRKQGLKYLFVN